LNWLLKNWRRRKPKCHRAPLRSSASTRLHLAHCHSTFLARRSFTCRQAAVAFARPAAPGIDIDRSTLAGWVGQDAALLDPIVKRINDTVLAGSKLHTDDTPVPMLDPGSGKKTARLWGPCDRRSRLWRGDKPCRLVRLHHRSTRRTSQSDAQELPGYLQADAYAGYDDPYRTNCVVEVTC
jgi:Transposase IS66 family